MGATGSTYIPLDFNFRDITFVSQRIWVDGYNLYHCTLGNDELGYIDLTDRGGSTYPYSCYGSILRII